MRHTRHFRPPFDPKCDFVYVKAFRLAGRLVEVGAPVDRTVFTPRRLKQMYDSRHIGYAPGQAPAPQPPAEKPLAVGPTDLANPGVASPPEKKVKRRVPRLLRAA